MHELVREGVNIEVIASSAPEHACIAHPAEAFVALRTIRGNAHEVSTLPPDADGPHAIHKIAGSSYLGCRLAGDAAGNFSDDVGGRWRSGKSSDFNVAESMKGEAWGKGFFGASAQDVCVP